MFFPLQKVIITGSTREVYFFQPTSVHNCTRLPLHPTPTTFQETVGPETSITEQPSGEGVVGSINDEHVHNLQGLSLTTVQTKLMWLITQFAHVHRTIFFNFSLYLWRVHGIILHSIPTKKELKKV